MTALDHSLPASICTLRLTLRAPGQTDIADIVAMANNANIFATTATLPFPYTRAHAEDFVAGAEHAKGTGPYVMAGMDNRVIGVMSLKLAAGSLPELGYWLGEPHWGQGYATEAAIGLLAAVRHLPGFAEVRARALESNRGSVRVLEKAGFTLFERSTGTLERHRGKPILVMRWRAA